MDSCDTIINKLKDCEPLGKVDEDEEQVRGDGLRILDKNDKKKSNSLNNKEMWWKNCDDEDPITLEPIADLAVPPFMLHSLPFDSKALSAYCVARSMFQNPLTRTPMTFADCQALDVHVEQHHGRGEGGGVKVSEAFRLHESIRVKGSEGGEGGEGDVTGGGEAVARRQEEIRRVAAGALQNLFNYRMQAWGARGTQGSSNDGLVMIDDSLVVAEAADRWAESARLQGEAPEPGSKTAFPDLSEEASEKGIRQGQRETHLDVRGVVERAAEQKRREEEEERERKIILEERERVERLERGKEREMVKEYHKERIRREKEEDERKRAVVVEAREEIERWRRNMFAKAVRVEERVEERVANVKVKEVVEEAVEEVKEIPTPSLTKEEREKLKKARKKAKEKEKIKEKKKLERERKEKEEARKKVEEEKMKSGIKCDCCGCGILTKEDAFNRDGGLFCTTKCAREGGNKK